MTTTSLNDTLPLTLENSNKEIKEILDEEKTYYGWDTSFSEDSEGSSVQLLCEIGNLESSN